MTAKRTDTNQAAIVRWLEGHGIQVVRLDDAGRDRPDLLVCHREWVLLEVKRPDGQVSRGQLRFMAEARGPVGIATDIESALRIAKEPGRHALTVKEKERLMIWLALEREQKTVRIGRFQEIIGRKA